MNYCKIVVVIDILQERVKVKIGLHFLIIVLESIVILKVPTIYQKATEKILGALRELWPILWQYS